MAGDQLFGAAVVLEKKCYCNENREECK